MIYTGYYACLKHYKDLKVYAISNSVPKGIDIDKIDLFVPKWKIVKDYKDGRLTEEDYTKLYIEQLNGIDNSVLSNILNELQKQDSILVCYEKVGSFCHRNILANWLSSYGLEVKEYDI